MSTQQVVTQQPKAVGPGARLYLAGWVWLGLVTAAAVLALGLGGEVRAISGEYALAASLALAGFALGPRAGEQSGDVGLIASALLVSTGLTAGSGGWTSPAAATLLLGPSLALALGRPWIGETALAALSGFALAGGLARYAIPEALGMFPTLLGAAGLAGASGLMMIRPHGGAQVGALQQRVAEVSHELRTPLNHILGFSEMIERQMFGELAERYIEYAGLIRRSGAHLLALVNDLLDLSRIEAGRYTLETEEFDARTVVADVVRLNIDAAGAKSIELGLITPEAPLMVRADANAIRRILINTVGNALKFTPQGGRVMVRLSNESGALVLETIDNGAGIPEAERARLGAPYERGAAGNKAEGTGLGLALVRALAALHGGALSFHDAPGGGALVRVALPVLL